VIVRYLNVQGILVFPSEADAKLVVDADAVLALTISTEFLEAIARGEIKIIDPHREADSLQSSQRDAGDISEFPASPGKPKLPCVFIREGPNHVFSVARLTPDVKGRLVS
jgi:hypothetical protein